MEAEWIGGGRAGQLGDVWIGRGWTGGLEEDRWVDWRRMGRWIRGWGDGQVRERT